MNSDAGYDRIDTYFIGPRVGLRALTRNSLVAVRGSLLCVG